MGHKPKVQVSMLLVNNDDSFINSLLALSQKSEGKRAEQQLQMTKAQSNSMQIQVLEYWRADL